MAKGYWSVAGSITNPSGMGPYLQSVEPYLAQCGARFLYRDLDTDVREGDPGASSGDTGHHNRNPHARFPRQDAGGGGGYL